MRAWFDNLEHRDQTVVSAGAVLVALIVAWGFIWTPLRGGASELDGAVAEKQQLLATLQRVEALGGPMPARINAATTQSLVLMVDETHRAHGLTGSLSRTQPDGTDGIRVTFQAASFDSLVNWLVALQRSYGVVVESANFSGSRQAGFVSATLVLRRS